MPHLPRTLLLPLPPPASAGLPELLAAMVRLLLPHLVADTSPRLRVAVPPLAVPTDVVVSAVDPRAVHLMNESMVDVVVQ